MCRLNELLVAQRDKEKNSELSSQALEKELSVKNQAIELHKRKAQESVQVELLCGMVTWWSRVLSHDCCLNTCNICSSTPMQPLDP